MTPVDATSTRVPLPSAEGAGLPRRWIDPLWLLIGGGAVLLVVAVAVSIADRSGDDSRTHAYEITWQEETTQRQFVNSAPSCQGVVYCEYSGPSGEWVTVDGPTVTRTDVVCASSIREARATVGSDVTVNGRELDSSLCERE